MKFWRLACRTTATAVLSIGCLVLVLLSASGADTIGLHSGLWQDKNDCYLCHRSFSSGGFALRQAADADSDFCLTCHGDGTGAATDVRDGLYLGTSDVFGNKRLAVLNGGGFESMNTATGNAGITSLHKLDEVLPVWGAKEKDKEMVIDCSSCHDPHTNGNYRWLSASSNAAVASNENGFGTNEYQPSYTVAKYRSGIAGSCISCHDAYDPVITASQQHVLFDAGDGKGSTFRYHHPTEVALGSYTGKLLSSTLPLEQPEKYNPATSALDQMSCLTCHRAHGTNAKMRGFAAFTGPTRSSSLLRLDDRKICQDCHEY